MKVRDCQDFEKKPPAFAMGAAENVSAAIDSMVARNIGSVVVVDDDRKVLGIVTERDLLRRLLGQGLDPAQTPLSSVMTKSPRTARMDDEATACFRAMSNDRFRHLPIVDDDGRLVNILSEGDFIAKTWPEVLSLLTTKTTETLRGPSAQMVGALLLYTLALVAMSRVWEGFSFQ